MKGRTVEIICLRDLEKEFTNISKLFTGKETEHNWEARDASVRRLHQFLNSELIEQYKDEALKGLHDHMSGIIKSIHSLRTAVAIEALSFIEDTSYHLGDRIDIYTLETILSNLLKCSTNTKKMIATKTEQVTIAFLTNTSFHSKLMTMLCKTVSEKNVQLRHFAANYIKSLLSAHGSKETVRSAIAKTELSQYIEQFLRKGLVDASPAIREACRLMYGMYRLYWPDQAERLNDSLDTAVQRQLEKSTPKASPRLVSKPVVRTLVKRSNSMSSVSSSASISSSNTTVATSPSSTTTFKSPTIKRTFSFKTSQPNIPATSAEVRRNLTAQRLSRLSHISNVSAPATDVSHKLNRAAMANTSQQQRRTQSEFHLQSAHAASSLLHMLKSNDTLMQCKGIHQLSQKLQNVTYDPSSVTTTSLPPGVPSRIDLVNVFTNMLSRNDLDLELYHTLMSWESLAGIFVYIMSLNYYVPTLIIANQQECHNQHTTPNEQKMKALYSKGLKRIKLFLKCHDPHLPKQLLDMMQGLQTNNMDLFDAHIKRDLMAYPHYKLGLQCGLLNWLDEILCDYVGLYEDEDPEISMEGSKWLQKAVHQQVASQWFDDNFNVRSLIRFVLHRLNREQNQIYPILCRMAAHLKMGNERVFEQEMNELNSIDYTSVQKALSVQVEDDNNMDDLLSIFDENKPDDDTEKLNDLTVDSTHLENLYDEVVKENAGKWNEPNYGHEDQSTGMTQEISKMNLKTDSVFGQQVLADLPEEGQQEEPQDDLTLGSTPVEIESNTKFYHQEKSTSPSPEPIQSSFKEEPVLEDESIVKDEPILENEPIIKCEFIIKDEPIAKDESLIKESKQDIHFYSKKKLARPAPEPSTSTNSVRDEKESKDNLESNKKRRLDENTLPDTTNGLGQCLTEISQYTATKATFKRIQKLIVGNSITRNTNNKAYWNQCNASKRSLFVQLLDVLVNFINNHHGHQDRLYALDTLIRMLIDLRVIFKELEDKGQDVTIYQLVKMLVDNNSDNQSEMDIKAEKALNMLLSIHSPELALQILWRLSSVYLAKENKMGNLLILISELAPKASPTALEKSLQAGAADILIWGYGHTNACIRKSSFLASAGIHQVLGDPYIGTYLPTLKPEQKTILVHYIETAIKR